MSELDLPTLSESSGIEHSVAPDARNYSRPNESFIASDIPNDIQAVDDKEEIKLEDPTIKTFQNFFSQSHSLIGRLYGGPIDGIVNPNLIQAAKATETAIAKAINNKSAYGMLWNDNNKKFLTTPQDVESALNLIQSHNKSLITEK